MNKKILVSLSVIAAVAAIVVGGTVAFFSDTETSKGNTFTAGTLDLLVDSDCMYNGMECINGYWNNVSETGNGCSCYFSEKNLTGSDLFFDFADVKPGDSGEDTISLHVVDNDAWACVQLGPLKNKDNGCNEPERKAEKALHKGEPTCDGDPQGELGDNLYLTIWADYNCDNVWDGGNGGPGEPVLTSGPANGDPLDGVTWTLADKDYNVFTGSGPLIGSTTYCIGVAWNVPPGVDNIIQSDSVSGNIVFSAYQARNNNQFACVERGGTLCCDGIDNDLDGNVDSADSGCVGVSCD